MKFALGIVFLLLIAGFVALIWGLNQWGVRLQDVRDVVIIVMALSAIFFFLAGIVAALGIYIAVRMLLGKVGGLLDEPIKPAIAEVRGTLQEIRGTVAFVSDTAVSPVIRVVSVARGVRRAASSIVRRGG